MKEDDAATQPAPSEGLIKAFKALGNHIKRLEGQQQATMHVVRALVDTLPERDALVESLVANVSWATENMQRPESDPMYLQVYLQTLEELLSRELSAKVTQR